MFYDKLFSTPSKLSHVEIAHGVGWQSVDNDKLCCLQLKLVPRPISKLEKRAWYQLFMKALN